MIEKWDLYRYTPMLFRFHIVCPLGPSAAICWHRYESSLAQISVCCLTAPSRYLYQCWHVISEVEWHSSDSIFARDTVAINHQNQLENYLYKILFKSPLGVYYTGGFSAMIAKQGLYSLSGKTSYRQISWSLEAARLDVVMVVSLWNLTGTSAAALPRYLPNVRAIGKV